MLQSLFARSHHPFVDLRIVLSHYTSGEMLLHMCPRYISIDLIDPWDGLYHLIEMMHEKACLPIHYDLRCSPASEGDDGTSQRHCLKHRHAKGFLPLNRVEETSGSAQEASLLLQIHRPYILDLFIIELWLDHLVEVMHRFLPIAVNCA